MEQSILAKEERTKRHAENKRRYRARRQEYVADLELRLAESRQQDNLAMKEVQLAAQKVVQENIRLKALLHLSGIEDRVVSSWLSGSNGAGQGGHTSYSNSRQEMISRATQTCSKVGVSVAPARRQYAVSAPTCSSSTPTLRDLDGDLERQILPKNPTTPLCSNEEPSYDCLNVSHLLAQPDADSRASSARPVDDGVVGDGVECSMAFRMAMPFATSDEKADAIAQKLKEGCVLNKDGRGCKVRTSVMWEALDKAISET